MDQISIGTDLDRISDLPGNVIDQILAFLPFKEAVRTSTLSKKWEDKWHTLPHIIIDNEMYKKRYGRRLESVINYILTKHEGRIEKFYVLVEVKQAYNVKSWIWRLEKKGVKQFFLCYHRSSEDKEVPSNLFSCQQLTKLSLHDCVVKPVRSPSRGGLQRLVSLELNEVNMETSAVQELISSCPLLEQLTLRKLRFAIDDRLDLQLNGPKLKYFCFDGEFASVCFNNTPFLEIFDINVYGYRKSKYSDYYYVEREFDLKFKIFGLPSTIEELYVRCEFQKYMVASKAFAEIETYNLRTLQLKNLCLENVEQVLCLLFLIGASDKLTTLDISTECHYTCGCRKEDMRKAITKFWEEQNNVHLISNHLKKVRVRSFKRNDPEIKLIQYVMTNSLALEEMIVECVEDPKVVEDKVKGVLQLFCKTSTQLSFIEANHKSSSEYDDFNQYRSHIVY